MVGIWNASTINAVPQSGIPAGLKRTPKPHSIDILPGRFSERKGPFLSLSNPTCNEGPSQNQMKLPKAIYCQKNHHQLLIKHLIPGFSLRITNERIYENFMLEHNFCDK